VTVAIRSDGTVESVVFVSSSGVAAIDEAIPRIVHSQANYPAFPPGLARRIRRDRDPPDLALRHRCPAAMIAPQICWLAHNS
jgi:hypothetical protein